MGKLFDNSSMTLLGAQVQDYLKSQGVKSRPQYPWPLQMVYLTVHRVWCSIMHVWASLFGGQHSGGLPQQAQAGWLERRQQQVRWAPLADSREHLPTVCERSTGLSPRSLHRMHRRDTAGCLLGAACA